MFDSLELCGIFFKCSFPLIQFILKLNENIDFYNFNFTIENLFSEHVIYKTNGQMLYVFRL